MKYYLLFIAFILFSCSSNSDFSPKPRGYNYIDLPNQSYVQFSENELPYTFKYASSAKVINDTKSFKVEKTKFYKIISYPSLGCEIYLTYKPITNNLNSLILEGYDMRDAHEKRAYGFDESYGKSGKGYNVARFQLSGEVPSPYQFMIHDSTKNFIRGALYFPIAPKNDSLAPIIDFVKKDIDTFIESIEFKN